MKLKHRAFAFLIVASVAMPAFAYGNEVEVKQETGLRASTTLPRVEMKKAIEVKKNELKQFKASTTEAIKEKMDELKNKRASTTEAIHEVKKEFHADRAKKEVITAGRVLGATADRLDKIVGRISSRLLKIKAAGGNTAAAEVFVNAAKTNLVDARVHISLIASLDLSSASTTAEANFQKVKAEAKAARESLHSAHQNLEKALNVIRELEKTIKVPDIEVHATSTATTTVH